MGCSNYLHDCPKNANYCQDKEIYEDRCCICGGGNKTYEFDGSICKYYIIVQDFRELLKNEYVSIIETRQVDHQNEPYIIDFRIMLFDNTNITFWISIHEYHRY